MPAANNEPAVTDLIVKLEDSNEVVKALTGAIYALKSRDSRYAGPDEMCMG